VEIAANPVESKEMDKNKMNIWRLILPKICEMPTTAPFLALSNKYKEIKLKMKFTVFIPPTNIKKVDAVILLIIEVPIIAACELPSAGRNETRPPEKTLTGVVMKISLLFKFGYVICCSGIFVFEFKLNNKVEMPNNPENKGNKG